MHRRFWVARSGTGPRYTWDIGEGDDVIATVPDRSTAMLFRAAPDLFMVAMAAAESYDSILATGAKEAMAKARGDV